MERKGLGRGLSSLIGAPSVEDKSERILQISIAEIRPNSRQPRQEWNEESLSELADSIRANGILQPLIVRGRPGNYELVAGERRLRAARKAGMESVPAILRETDDLGALRLALIENIQREDISALDAAQAYRLLMDDFGMKQEDVARAVGKSRPVIGNTVRLLLLPAPIVESLRSREITEGHARALINIEDQAEQLRVWNLAKEGATVREIEAAASEAKMRSRSPEPCSPQQPAIEPTPVGVSGSNELSSEPPLTEVISTPSTPSHSTQLRTTVRQTHQALPHIEDLEDRLRRTLGLKIEIRGDDRRGMLCIEYYSEDDLETLSGLLLQEN